MQGEREGVSERERDFKFSPEHGLESKETENNKFEVEITKEDIEGIKGQMEEEYRTDHAQRWAFEAAAMAKMSEMAAGEEKEMFGDTTIPYAQYEMNEKRVKEDTRLNPAKMKDFVDSRGNKRYGNWTSEDCAREKVWGQMFSESYRNDFSDSIDPDYVDSKKIEKRRKLSLSEWADMKNNLKEDMGKGNWREVIPKAGHMKNIDPEKFAKEIKFSEQDEQAILKEIEVLSKGDQNSDNEKRRKANPWELASRIRYISEISPELAKKIKIGKEDWKNMSDLLNEARDKKDYWKLAYHGCNMKVIEGLIKRGEIGVEVED